MLRELLADGPLAARKIFEKARNAGISEITLRRAKAREGVGVQKVGFQDGARWLWSHPSTSRRPPCIPETSEMWELTREFSLPDFAR